MVVYQSDREAHVTTTIERPLELLDWDLLLETIQQVKEGARVPGYLLGIGSDTKTVKAEKFG